MSHDGRQNIVFCIFISARAFYLNLCKYLLSFSEKYDLVGRLLKPGEVPRNYSDEEDDQPSNSEKEKKDN